AVRRLLGPRRAAALPARRGPGHLRLGPGRAGHEGRRPPPSRHPRLPRLRRPGRPAGDRPERVANLRVRPGGGAQALSCSAEGTAGEHAGGQEPLFAAPAVPVPEPSPSAAAPTDPGRLAASREPGLRTTAGSEVVRARLVGVLRHLDRAFEYAGTPETAAAGPGMRVRVRFSGKDTEGIVLERCAEPSTDRPLAPLHRLVSEDVVVPPAMMRVCED